MRIPESMIDQVMTYITRGGYTLPLYESRVSAGFPSPAEDYIEGSLDLNEHLIKHPASTFFVRVSGESMLNAGIHPGDILVVDRSLKARTGKIVIAAYDGHLTVKRLVTKNTRTYLMPENNDFHPIEVTESNDVLIWGVVTTVLHSV